MECGVVSKEFGADVAHLVWEIIYENEEEERTEYRALWHAKFDWTGTWYFVVDGNKLFAVGKIVFDELNG